MRRTRLPALLAVAVTLAACGTSNGRHQAVAQLQKALRNDGMRAHILDRHSALVGPPVIRGCDPPIVAGRLTDNAVATLYVCADAARARNSQVPIYLPGRRLIRGRTIAVIDGPADFAKEIAGVLISIG